MTNVYKICNVFKVEPVFILKLRWARKRRETPTVLNTRFEQCSANQSNNVGWQGIPLD